MMMMQIWLEGGERWNGEYHANGLTYALIACIGSPSCAFSNSVALTFDNSNSATCCERNGRKRGSCGQPLAIWGGICLFGLFVCYVIYPYNRNPCLSSSVFIEGEGGGGGEMK